MSKKSVDIVLCSVPFLDTDGPLMAPGILKSSIETAGFTAKTLDLNIEVLKIIRSSVNYKKLVDFFHNETVTADTVEEITELIKYCTKRIIDTNPKCIGLSLLTYASQIFTRWLCVNLKTEQPNIPIVIGGSGIKNFLVDSNNSFCDDLRNHGLIDDYIMGDGEHSIVEYLKGNINYPGINSQTWNQITDLDSLPWADYSDYDFSLYSDVTVPIIDSRGCVRSCEFCDIIQHWKKYKYRSAENVWNEIQHQIKKHGIRHITFRNSLTNGNMKNFRALVKYMADYNRANEQNKISWAGYFIIRDAQQHPESMWQDIADSGGYLWLGVESVVQRVRHQLGKKFDNIDIDYHLEQAKKWNVPLMLLIIVGYPSETRNDYEFTKQWFRDRKIYANKPVKNVLLSPASILPGTALEKKSEDYGIKLGKYPSIWINHQLNISVEEKLKYYKELEILVKDLGFDYYEHIEKTLEVTKVYANM